MRIAAAENSDVESAIECLDRAFIDDSHMKFLFGDAPAQRRALVREFFTILLTVRLAVGMPVLVIRDEERFVGMVMGYDTRRPEWPPTLKDRWQVMLKSHVGLPERMDVVDQFAASCEPKNAHYYLGVVGVDPMYQGRGAGGRLIGSFCELSAQDSESFGVFIETAEAGNAAYYQRRGFELTGSKALDETCNLYCLFRSHQMHSRIR